MGMMDDQEKDGSDWRERAKEARSISATLKDDRAKRLDYTL
jgi:hypothetical protein